MRRQILARTAVAGACLLVSGCTNVVDGSAVAGAPTGLANQKPIPTAALESLLLDTGAINAALGATSMKVWFSANNKMWDWSKNIPETNCLAVDGAAQEKVYTGTGWSSMRGQRLDDSVDDSNKRKYFAIQSVVAFPNALDASNFYNSSVQSWKSCGNRQFKDVAPNRADTVWVVADVVNQNGMLSTSEVQDRSENWTCQRALTVRNNVAVDVVACAYNETGSVAVDVASQIAAKTAKL